MSFQKKLIIGTVISCCLITVFTGTVEISDEVVNSSKIKFLRGQLQFFGELRNNEAQTRTVDFINVSDSDIVITGIKKTCACSDVSIVGDRKVLAGMTGQFKISMVGNSLDRSKNNGMLAIQIDHTEYSIFKYYYDVISNVYCTPRVINIRSANGGKYGEFTLLHPGFQDFSIIEWKSLNGYVEEVKFKGSMNETRVTFFLQQVVSGECSETLIIGTNSVTDPIIDIPFNWRE